MQHLKRNTMATAGTKENPWQLKTPPNSSDYEMYRDVKDGKDVIVCVVGKTTCSTMPVA